MGLPTQVEVPTGPSSSIQVDPLEVPESDSVATQIQSVQDEEATVVVAKKVRDPWLDNARIFAAVLIVVMHFAPDLRANSSVVDALYYGLWPMRVPLYVLVAGYFSSAAPLTGRRAVSLLRNIFFVYVAFRLIAMVQGGLLHGSWNINLATPSFALWFLLALFWWRLTLPLFNHIKYLPAIAVVVAIGAGFLPAFGPEFSASRAIAFWPIFIVG